MSENRIDPTAVSRRTLLAGVGAAPLICAKAEASAAVESETLISRCTRWMSLEFEADELARRWSALETLAAGGYDYFRMDDRQRRGLPMGPEMAAIEEQLDQLFEGRKQLFGAIKRMAPANIHEAASFIAVAARIEVHEPGPAAPLVRKALEFIAEGKCPRCGEPYVPSELLRV